MPESALALAFVCRRCNALSPMAAALAEALGPAGLEASCAGLDPDDRILPGALTALREVGAETAGLLPTPASRGSLEAADVVVAIGLVPDEHSLFEGLDAEAWPLESPEGGSLAAFREVRDELGLRVRRLLREQGLEPGGRGYSSSSSRS